MTHDEMTEAVAKAIGDTTDFDGDRMASRYADSELADLARAAIRVIAPAVERETLDRAATEAWSTMNGAVGLCECADCVSQNIRAMKTRYEQ